MAYTKINFKTKKELKEALSPKFFDTPVEVFQPNADLTGARFVDGQIVVIEGPHYPEPHRWYARVKLKMVVHAEKEPFFVIERIIS